MKPHNLIGQKFGNLTVISRDTNKKGRAYWICKCDCGTVKKKSVNSYDLITNKVRSCGCAYKESNINNRKVHGLTNHRLFGIWQCMIRRCYYPKMIQFENYGGRGITVCKEWRKSFQIFYDWSLANGYKDDLTIDRIDVNGDYEPSNCRWATKKEQNNNRRTNRIVMYQNCTYTVSQLATKLKIPYATLLWRINNNWCEQDLDIEPKLNNRWRKNNVNKF
jgi:hypothetical protein